MAEETSDVPTTSWTFQQNPVVKRLAAFVGTWQWEASIDGQPFGRGCTVWAWLEGGAANSI